MNKLTKWMAALLLVPTVVFGAYITRNWSGWRQQFVTEVVCSSTVTGTALYTQSTEYKQLASQLRQVTFTYPETHTLTCTVEYVVAPTTANGVTNLIFTGTGTARSITGVFDEGQVLLLAGDVLIFRVKSGDAATGTIYSTTEQLYK